MSRVQPGCLWVVATPIGHRDDLSTRAIETLRTVAVIAAEDTRHSRPLLLHHGVATPLVALHDHNEREVVDALVARLQAGESVALISDAGTPLISDPGFRLVRAARAAGIRCAPVPGACA
ncbi:MAG: SAM-dependent methyltransferase, partial [Rhodanobacter sp.]